MDGVATLSAYWVEVSHYPQALKTARQLRARMATATAGPLHECAALTSEGVALFTSFQDLMLAERLLRQAIAYEPQAHDDTELMRWIAMAYHYLGRLAEVDRRFRTSLELYVHGDELARASRENIVSEAFVHLRLAEPLTPGCQGLVRPAVLNQ